jgi:hypothetical protein
VSDQPLYRNRQPRWRAARRQEMRICGIVPANRQKVWCVRCSGVGHIPQWIHEQILKPIFEKRVGGLTFFSSPFVLVWLRPKQAKRLIGTLRTHNIWYEVIESEFKRCQLCSRPLISLEATKLRTQIESSPSGRSLPCGPNCGKDRESGLWRLLSRSEKECEEENIKAQRSITRSVRLFRRRLQAENPAGIQFSD